MSLGRKYHKPHWKTSIHHTPFLDLGGPTEIELDLGSFENNQAESSGLGAITVMQGQGQRRNKPGQQPSAFKVPWSTKRKTVQGFIGRSRAGKLHVNKQAQAIIANAWTELHSCSMEVKLQLADLFPPVGSIKGTTLASRILSGLTKVHAKTIENQSRHVSHPLLPRRMVNFAMILPCHAAQGFA